MSLQCPPPPHESSPPLAFPTTVSLPLLALLLEKMHSFSSGSWTSIPLSSSIEVGKLWLSFLGGYLSSRASSLVAQTVKNLPAMWETWVRSLGREDPLEKGMAS